MKLTIMTPAMFSILTLTFMTVLDAEIEIPELKKDTFNSSQKCGVCHKAIFSYWSRSSHALSYSDPVFDLAYLKAYRQTAGEAKKFCLRCHAPTVLITEDYDTEMDLTREGVTCDFCHSVQALKQEGEGLWYKLNIGGVKFGPFMDTESKIHDTKRVDFLTTSEFCAGCHELRGENGVPIISTYSEWKESPQKREGIQCQDCHMPVGEEYIVAPELKETKKRINLHDVSGRHHSQLEKAARIEIDEIKKFGDKRTVLIGVTNSGSGHKIPTGTPSRVLILKVRVLDQNGQVIYTREEVFKKTLIDSEGNILVDDTDLLLKADKVYQDNRILPGETRYITVSFEADKNKQVVIDARLLYKYRVKIEDYEEILVEMASDVRTM
ncbi:MAG: multiheme c-type cytochrome [Candidatus Glassbacteria bacterium]